MFAVVYIQKRETRLRSEKSGFPGQKLDHKYCLFEGYTFLFLLKSIGFLSHF